MQAKQEHGPLQQFQTAKNPPLQSRTASMPPTSTALTRTLVYPYVTEVEQTTPKAIQDYDMSPKH